MNSETRWWAVVEIRHRLGSAPPRALPGLMDKLSELLDCGRTAAGLALAERLAAANNEKKRGFKMAKNQQDGKQIERESNAAAIAGSRAPMPKDAPQAPADPDVKGNRGSGVFKNPSVVGSGPGQYPGPAGGK